MIMFPAGKEQFYPKGHRDLRNAREDLLNEDISPSFNALSELERALVQEATYNIMKQGLSICITNDLLQYKKNQDQKDPWVLCDQFGNVKDLEPLLPYVSEKTKSDYELLRKAYLSSH